LLARAVAGEEVIIMQAGRQLARLEPVPGARFECGARLESRLGTAKGKFFVPDDFNAPLPDDVLDEFEK
jgi:antitoxin (DNA-binding transcriptional repressor) of toxin-antitoxin stability system